MLRRLFGKLEDDGHEEDREFCRNQLRRDDLTEEQREFWQRSLTNHPPGNADRPKSFLSVLFGGIFSRN